MRNCHCKCETPAAPGDPSPVACKPAVKRLSRQGCNYLLPQPAQELQGLGLGMDMPGGICMPGGIGVPVGVGVALGVGVSAGMGIDM
jgi:hypothetical protein